MISDNIVLGRRRLIPLFDPAQPIASAVTTVEKNLNPHVAAEAYVKLLYPTRKPHWGQACVQALRRDIDRRGRVDGLAPSSRLSGGSVLSSLAAISTSILIEPVKQRTYARPGQGDGTISSAIIDVERVGIGIDGVSAREYDIVHVAVDLILRLRREYPGISSQ